MAKDLAEEILRFAVDDGVASLSVHDLEFDRLRFFHQSKDDIHRFPMREGHSNVRSRKRRNAFRQSARIEADLILAWRKIVERECAVRRTDCRAPVDCDGRARESLAGIGTAVRVAVDVDET